MKKRSRKPGRQQEHHDDEVPQGPVAEEQQQAFDPSFADDDDGNASFNAADPARTPVRQRGNRGAASSLPAWDQMLQTPERHRGVTGNLASWLASPQTHGLSSPMLFSSPEPVPLFQPSPKRAVGLQSPGGVNGFGNLFQSPVRGGGVNHDLLRFETPHKPQFTGLVSPSPRRSRRVASGQRKRAVSLEAVGWGQLDQLGLQGDSQHFVHTTEDDERDLVKDLLQSPGPKEVQQLADLRPQTRSRSHLAPVDAAAAAGSVAEHMQAAAAAAAEEPAHKPPAHPRRRALDFSKAEAMNQGMQSLPGRSRSSRHGSSHAGLAAVADHHHHQQQQQHQHGDQQQLQSSFQPHLPLIPLDLSECEKHNPSSSPLKAAGGLSSGITPRRGRSSSRQHALLEAAFTSPRSALDAAAAVVAGGAMQELGIHLGALDPNDPMRSMPRLVRPAFEGLGHAEQQHHSAAAAAAAAATSSAPFCMMVPLGSATPAAGAAAQDSQEQMQQQQQQQQQAMFDSSAVQNLLAAQQEHRDYAMDADDEAGEQQDEDQLEAAAAAGGSGSKRWNLRPHGKKQYLPELQPSRRSRRIAGDTPDKAEQQDAAAAAAAPAASPGPTTGSSGKRRRQMSRLARLQQQSDEEEEQQQQQQKDEEQQQRYEQQDPQQLMEQQQQQQAEELQAAYAAAVAAAAADGDQEGQAGDIAVKEEDDQGVHANERPMSRSGGRRGQQKQRKGSKGSRGGSQQYKGHTDDTGDEEADPEAAAAAAAEVLQQQQQQLYGLPAVTGLQQLLGSAGLQQLQLQLHNGMPLALQQVGATPDRQTAHAQLGGAGGAVAGLMGPGTPDDVRLAHVAAPQMMPMRSCHCKKSQCLKLYCDCFASGTYCSGCACNDCRNVESNAQEVVARRNFIQQRDPNAFATKLAQRADQLTSRKGCKCKKSHCLKKYCECYQMGVRCGDLCKCSDCQNQDTDGTGGPPGAYAKQLMPRTLHRQPSSGARMQHTQQYWPLQGLGQPLPAVSGSAATSVASMGLGTHALSAQAAQLMLRLQGGPGTPGSTQMLCLPLQSPAQGTAAASYSNPGSSTAVVQLQPENLGGASMASTPNPPKSSGEQHHREHGVCLTAKPLLPQFMKAAGNAAAAAAAAGSKQQQQQQRVKGGQTPAAAAAGAADDAACLLTDEELPTPDQLAAENNNSHGHHFSPSSSDAGDAGRSGFARVRNLMQGFAQQQQQQQQQSSPAASQKQHGHARSPVAAAHRTRAGSGSSPAGHLSPAATSAAAATSSSGGTTGSPRGAAGPGSVTSKGRHRLASTSRATDELPQQQQQQGIMALVSAGALQQQEASGAAAVAAAAVGNMGNTRRQLLQQVKEEEDASTSCWARPQRQQQLQPPMLGAAAAGASMLAPPALHWQRTASAAAAAGSGVCETPAKASAAADGDAAAAYDDGQANGSPVQQVFLGPNGPMVVLPQRALASAMNQATQLGQTAAGSAALDSSTQAAAAAAGDESSQSQVGMLMTVVDEQGNVQYFFLPGSQAAPPDSTAAAAAPDADAAGAHATAAVKQEEEQQDQQQQSQQQQPYLLRRRAANPLQGTGYSRLPAADDMVIDQPQQQPQHPAAGSNSAKQQQQSAPGSPAAPSSSAAAAAGCGRSLRSSSSSGTNKTPIKRSTPVKRKAEDADADHKDQQLPGDTTAAYSCQPQPSPAKLQHQLHLTSPGQQQHDQQQLQLLSPRGNQQQQLLSPRSQARQVMLSPVKLTRNGGMMVVQPQQQSPEQLQQGIQQAAQAWLNDSNASSSSTGFSSPVGLRAPALPLASTQVLAMLNAETQQQQQQQQGHELQAAQQAAQLFIAHTADGQQFLLQAPAGTDPAMLLAPDGSIDGRLLSAVKPGGHPTAWPATAAAAAASREGLQQQATACAPAGLPSGLQLLQHYEQQQYEQQQHPGVKQHVGRLNVARQGSGGTSSGSPTGVVRWPDAFQNMSPQPKVLLSPRDARTRDGSLFKFSPGCTTVFSPNKPKLGSSPS